MKKIDSLPRGDVKTNQYSDSFYIRTASDRLHRIVCYSATGYSARVHRQERTAAAEHQCAVASAARRDPEVSQVIEVLLVVIR